MKFIGEDKNMQFVGDKFVCTDCDDIIRSSYPGEFIVCSCGESFVDQTQFYTRMGGHCASLHYLLNQDFEDLLAIDEVEEIQNSITIYLVTVYHEFDQDVNFVLGMFRDLEHAKESGTRYCQEDMRDEGLESPRYYYVVSEYKV